MIYIAFDGDILKNSELFFPSSLHLIRILHFEGSSHIALLAFNVFLSPPLKIQIQTITRRAVILPASGMSENLLLISHVKKKKKITKRSREDGNSMALFVTFWHPLKWTVRSYGLRLIRRRCHTHYCVKQRYKKTQWETGRGLIALTLADSGQRQHIRTADEALLPHTIHFCCCDTQRHHCSTWQKCWITFNFVLMICQN